MESIESMSDEPSASKGVEPDDADEAMVIIGQTHEGQVRELNEDSLRWESIDDRLTLCAVADGMGGHDRGEVASQLAVETLFEQVGIKSAKASQFDQQSLKDLLRTAFYKANLAVLECGRENDSNMGTTLTTAMIYRRADAYLANVGDSRAYLLRDGALQQVTRDHSLVAYLVQMGELTKEQARTHPSGNILVRSVGSTEDVEIDVFHVSLNPGDSLLLATDGLWSELPDEDILMILEGAEDPKDACEQLVVRCNEAGGKDNITCLIVSL